MELIKCNICKKNIFPDEKICTNCGNTNNFFIVDFVKYKSFKMPTKPTAGSGFNTDIKLVYIPGSKFKFNGLEITIGNDITITDNGLGFKCLGLIAVKIPIAIKNMNYKAYDLYEITHSFKIFTPKGKEVEKYSWFFFDDSILDPYNKTYLSCNDISKRNIYFEYAGRGKYTIVFYENNISKITIELIINK